MSTRNGIVIEVDQEGALKGIRDTAEAVRELARTAQEVTPLTTELAATAEAARASADAVDAARQAASGLSAATDQTSTALAAALDLGASTLGVIVAMGQAMGKAETASGLLGIALRRLPVIAVVAAVADLAAKLIELAGGQDDAARATDLYARAVEQSNAVLLTSEELAKRRAQAQRQAAVETTKAAQAALPAQRQVLAEELRVAQARLALADKVAANTAPNGRIGGKKALLDEQRQAQSAVEKARQDLEAVDAHAADLENRLATMQQQTEAPDISARRHARRVEEARRLTEAAMTEWERWGLEQDRLDELLTDRLITQDVWNRLVEQGNPALRLQAELLSTMSGELEQSTQRLSAANAEFDKLVQSDFDGALTTRTPTAILADAKAATETQIEEAKKAAQTQAEEVKKVADGIGAGLATSIFDQITGKGDSLKNWFKGLFKQIALDALKNKIVMPIVTSVVGAAPRLFGLAAGAAGAAGTASAVTGGGFDVLGGLTSAIDGLDAGVASLGKTLFGLAGKRGTATDGLLGSGGTLFGSSGLATGITGGLSGLGLGMTAAGLLGALGIGKGNSTGGAIGGAIGGIAGSFVPGLGTALGGLLGGAIGSLFGGKPSNKEGSAVIDLGSDNVAIGGFTGKKFSQENRDAAAGLAKQVLAVKNLLETGFGASITGTLAVGAGDRDGLFATTLNSTARTSFSADEAGAKQLVAFVTQQFVAGIRDQLAPEISAALGRVDFSDMEKAAGDLDFIRGFRDSLTALRGDFGLIDKVTASATAEVKAQTDAVRQFRDTTARLFPDAVAEADAALKSYVEGLVGIRQAAAPMTQVETAMKALEARFQAYVPLLEAVGYSAADAQAAMTNGLTKARTALKGEFETTLDRQYNEATGKGYVNQINDLIGARDTGYRDADALGVDRALIDRNFNAALAAPLDGLDRTQLEDLRTRFAAIDPVVTAVNAALARLDGALTGTAETAEQAAERTARTNAFRDGLADRQARATGAADTLDGQLAIHDRAAAAEKTALQERITAGELAAEVMVELEATQGAERIAIQTQFARADREAAEKLAAVNLSIQDRLFAATNDAATEAGALAAFDRKTGQERAELARTDGADLLAFDRATAAERLKIEQEFAGRRDALNLSFADRLFAATNDAATEAGALAAFDRQAARERLEVAKVLGNDLTAFEEATAAERLKIEQEFAERRDALNLSFADRLFAATNDAATEAGALAAFDRQAARERLEAAKVLGNDLTAFEEATAAERLKIEQEFAERRAAVNLSIQDRLFAAANDASTLAGALAAFDRQTARERAEIARTAGADLVGFDQATALERLRVGKEFAERAAAVNLSIQDRLFAAANDAATLAGALAAFDRQAARERVEAARTAGADLTQLEAAQGAERANIVKSFADKAIAEAQTAADQARDGLVAALNREAEAARTLATGWKQAGESLRGALTADHLSGAYSGLNPDQIARLAEDELRRLAARAQDGSLPADERLAAAQALPEARRAFLDAVRPLYEGTERWGQALDLSASLLDGVAAAAGHEVDLATRQVDLAEQQLTALGVVNQSVLTVAQALAGHQAALASLAQAQAAAAAPPPAPAAVTMAVPATVPMAVPANANQPAAPASRLQELRMALAGEVDQRTPFDGDEILTWRHADGSVAAALLASELRDRPQDYLEEIARKAGIPGFQRGGRIGNGLFDADSVLARYEGGGFVALAGGEWVTRATSVTPDTAPLLRAINDTGRPPAGLNADRESRRVEALLSALLDRITDNGRQQVELDRNGYGALVARLEQLAAQGGEAALERRRIAR